MLGFDCSAFEDNYMYRYCGLGIWFTNSTSCKPDSFPVWKPDYNFALYVYNLSISNDGVLHVKDIGGNPIWSSHHVDTTSVSAVAVLLDNGNLVIRDRVNSSMVIWQSFDSPTYILLSGGSLGFSPITGKNITLVAYYARLRYTLSLDATRRRGFVIQQNPGGRMFVGTFPRWMDISEGSDYTLTFNGVNTYMHLNSSGIITFAKQWECDSVLWSAPKNLCEDDSYCGPCDIDSYCGAYNLCTTSGSCKCPVGFYPPLTNGLGGGCSRKVPLNCERNVTEQEVAFYPIDGIRRYPQNAWMSKGKNLSDCESSCLRDCTCTAFAYNTTCLLWFFELRNMVGLESGSNGNRIYMRITSKPQQSSSRAAHVLSFSKRRVVLCVIGVIGFIAVGFILLWRCKRNLFDTRMMNGNGNLKLFSFVQIKSITKNFSEKLGEGSFGCVFKGTMKVSTLVAVKRLKGILQGDKQFRAEMQTIGMIQHTNLVRLLGFCADGYRRLLVYEYIVNGSLSSRLFSKRPTELSWQVRYHVALGIAKGLAYLHEECKDCIVHCDLKPDNILLDHQFCPKIADFGMAKLLGRNYSRVLTTMPGTIGYLAPEWISGVPITHKADVYSYGMMLLEIVSGRRNSEKIKEGEFTYFPIYAAIKVNEEDDIMFLLDSTLEGNADTEQLNRACRVACWCIQDAEDHRPMMGQVVRMLEGVMDVGVPPVPRSLQNYIGMEDSSSADLDSPEVSF